MTNRPSFYEGPDGPGDFPMKNMITAACPLMTGGRVKAAYYGMITLVDDNIGRVLDALEEKGIEEDTLIMFTNDHGELLGDHGLLFKGPFHYDSIIKSAHDY